MEGVLMQVEDFARVVKEIEEEIGRVMVGQKDNSSDPDLSFGRG